MDAYAFVQNIISYLSGLDQRVSSLLVREGRAVLINHTDSMKLFFVKRSCFVRLNLVTMVTRHERRQGEHNRKHKCTHVKCI